MLKYNLPQKNLFQDHSQYQKETLNLHSFLLNLEKAIQVSLPMFLVMTIRRIFINKLSLAVVVLSTLTLSAQAASHNKKPKNIIFLSFDELGAAFLGSYGSGVDSTPTMDRLASQGIRFERCYVVSPVCSPSRASWLTGRSPIIHGIIFNNLALSNDMPAFPYVLQQHGYRTGIFGKLHQTPMNWAEPDDLSWLGFDEGVITEDDKWGPWIDWVEAEHPQHLDAALSLTRAGPQSPAQKHLSKRAERAKRDILAPIKEASFWPAAYESPLPPAVHDSTFITNKSIEFMQRHLIENPEQPFLCYISYVDPHDPYNPPAPYSTLFDPDNMPDPIPMSWDPEEFDTLRHTLGHLNITDLHDDPAGMRKLRALFHGSIKFQDDQVARIERFLTESDLWSDTIILITTDHGEMMGDHGLITKGTKHYDSGIRVPLIVVGGGTEIGVSDRLTSSLDFYPTFMDWAGIDAEQRPPLEGISFAPDCIGQPTDGWRDLAIWACETTGGAYTLITDDGWRLTRYVDERGAGQMYNLFEDPTEQIDLYHLSQYADIKLDLFERLTVALTRPSRIPQYRNMPLVEGTKRIRDYSERNLRVETGVPFYKPPQSPALTGELK